MKPLYLLQKMVYYKTYIEKIHFFVSIVTIFVLYGE